MRDMLGLETGSPGQIDPEAVAAALVAPGHLGRGVPELLLHIALLDFGRRGQPGAQRMTGEEGAALAFAKIGPHAGGEDRRFDQTGDMTIIQAFAADAAAAGDGAKHGTMRDAAEASARSAALRPGRWRRSSRGRSQQSRASRSCCAASRAGPCPPSPDPAAPSSVWSGPQ